MSIFKNFEQFVGKSRENLRVGQDSVPTTTMCFFSHFQPKVVNCGLFMEEHGS